ncbi:MAG: hypothetical protein QNJ90_00270 [Planctomycetota bacterium]|nr:hypothetical protein [Planctomycetota bacterium]
MSRRALRRTYVAGNEVYDLDLRHDDGRVEGTYDPGDGERPIAFDVERLGDGVVRVTRDGVRARATVVRDGDTAWVAIDGHTYELRIEEVGGGAAHHAGEEDFAVSPMTGTLAKVSVEPGQQVEADAELFVVEAMKMEYVVRAPRDVTVAEVRHTVGEQVEQGRVVVTFEEAP